MKKVFFRLALGFALVSFFVERNNAQLSINEIFLTNASADLVIPDYNYLNWIEIKNTGSNNLNLTAYYLSNDSANLLKWKMPASTLLKGKYKYFYADGSNASYHTNFKPDPDGDTLFLSNSNGKVLDMFIYPKQIFNISYGRLNDSETQLAFLKVSTLGAANTAESIGRQIYTPVFQQEGGYYSAAFNLTLINPSSGKIYYTMDGNEPDLASAEYTSPIKLSKTTAFRARIIEDGKAPGKIVTQTYFINQRMPKMHIISLVTAPKNLFDDTIGIYVVGKNGIAGNCSSEPMNWNQDWERCINLEIFDKEPVQVINQVAGTKISGACSRGGDQKSMSVYARDKYGKTRFDYKFFDKHSFSNYNTILFRTAANDNFNSMIRDQVIQTLTESNMDIEHQMFTPASIYINGSYWGIQSLYEKSGEDLVEAKFGLKPEQIDLIEAENEVSCGSYSGYASLVSFLNNNSLSNQAAYNYVVSQIDVDNYMDYLILQIFVGNWDWPGNNIKYWRRTSPLGKWRWIIYDTDFGFGLLENNTATYRTLDQALNINSGWPNPEWSTLLFRKLVENEGFKRTFINRFYAHINSTFEPGRVIKVIDSVAALYANEIPYHFSRYNQSNYWTSAVEGLRGFANARPAIMRQHIRERFGLDDDVKVNVKNATGKGYFEVDNVRALDTAYEGYFAKNTPLKINFMPIPGYAFDHANKRTVYVKHFNVVETGNIWKYWDQGPGIDPEWNMPAFDDSTWTEGASQLGYGDNDEKTIISYGPDQLNKYTTSYFRKSIDLLTDTLPDSLQCSVLFDDGIILYVNGNEVFRANLPEGAIDYSTFATDKSGENLYTVFKLPKSYFTSGKNVISAEIHQSTLRSSDVSFDFLMEGVKNLDTTNTIITNQSYTDTLLGNIFFEVYYKPITEVPPHSIVINEVSPNNSIFKDEVGQKDDWFELYNYGQDTIDLAGFYFTDDTANLRKAMLSSKNPDSTKIYPNQYKVIWSDDQVAQGPLHLGIKLSKKGDYLGMYLPMGDSCVLIDEVSINAVPDKKTYARFPDVTGEFTLLNHGTPWGENMQLPEDPIDDAIELTQKDELTGTLRYFSNTKLLEVELEVYSKANVFVYDICGRTIVNKTFNGSTSINLHNQQTGIYLIKVVSNGKTINKKLFVK